uniref:Zinc finger protein 91-like n=1 Tax=Saccoglossus kowalevskii TaxID=10224 RepID=A0ABM0MCR9_SACKO
MSSHWLIGGMRPYREDNTVYRHHWVVDKQNGNEKMVKEEPSEDSKGVMIVETENGDTVVVKNHGNHANGTDGNMRSYNENYDQQDNEVRMIHEEEDNSIVIDDDLTESSHPTAESQKGDAGSLGYRCTVCGRKFSVFEVYVEHERSHANEGERPFICDVCNLSFKSTGSLVAHKRIHTGEKPFQCNYCWKTFRQSATRNRHIKAMHAEERRKSQKETMDKISQILSQQVVQYPHPGQNDRLSHQPEVMTPVMEHHSVIHPTMSTFSSQPVFPGMTPLRVDVPRTIATSAPAYRSPIPQEHHHVSYPSQHHITTDTHIHNRVLVAPNSRNTENDQWQQSISSKGTSSESSTPVNHPETPRQFNFSPPSVTQHSTPKNAVPNKNPEVGQKSPSRLSRPITSSKSTSPPEINQGNHTVAVTKESAITRETEIAPTSIKERPVPKNHSCAHCGKHFVGKAALKIHKLVKHLGEKPFACEMCNQRFVSASALITHRRRHTGEKPYKCNICGRLFRHSSTMKRHKLLRHNVFRRPFECSECGKAFKVMGHLVMHKRIHSGEKPFKCPDCGKAFRQKGTMSRHAKLHKNFEMMNNSQLNESGDVGDDVPQAGPSRLGLYQEIQHDESIPAEFRQMQNYIDEEFEDEEEDEEEEEEEDEEDIEDVEDDDDEEEEEESMVAVSPLVMDRTVKTSIMQPLRNRKAKLNVNTNIHSRWSCNICGKVFGNHWRLERHKMSHSNARPFPCEYCNKSFQFQSHLVAHRRIHTGEKPFQCNLCGKAFRQSATMHRHRKLHFMKFMPTLGLQSKNVEHLLTYLEGRIPGIESSVLGATTAATTTSQSSMTSSQMNLSHASDSTSAVKQNTASHPSTSAMNSETGVSIHVDTESSMHSSRPTTREEDEMGDGKEENE